MRRSYDQDPRASFEEGDISNSVYGLGVCSSVFEDIARMLPVPGLCASYTFLIFDVSFIVDRHKCLLTALLGMILTLLTTLFTPIPLPLLIINPFFLVFFVLQ